MIYDVVIVGGGVASLTAAIYTSRKALKTLIITENIGGQVLWATKIENYPGFKEVSGVELVSKMREQVEKLGAKIQEGEKIVKISKNNNHFQVFTKLKKISCKSVIIATGRKSRKLNVPGEKEFLGKGVAYCATCDAPLFKNKDVAIIGGGNAGLDAAIELTKYANKVYILEKSSHCKADKTTLDKAKSNKKITIIINAQVKEIKGKTFVDSLIYTVKSNKKILKVQGIFIEIGAIAVSDFTGKIINKNNFGEIIVDRTTMATNINGIFAAGDVTNNKYKQIIIACGEGAVAAISASDYLEKKYSAI